MENNQYIPFGVNHLSDDKLISLVELYGMQGYGIYVALLFELRKRCGYLCALQSLPALARRWEVDSDLLLSIVDDFGLFGFATRKEAEVGTATDGEPDSFFSPYLNEVMEPFVQKRLSNSVGGKVRAATAERAADGRFTSSLQLIEENRVKESKKEEKKEKRWELLLDEIFEEQSWVEIQAMHSGMGGRFMEQLPEIIGFFKNHVRTYGKEYTILCDADAKSYFSNFIRLGSATRKVLDTHLAKQQCASKAADPYRYEQRNPLTEERSYCGRPIPADAPPRPNENAVWNEELSAWD